MIVSLAARNFGRHSGRFAVVWVALSLGFAAVMVLLGVTGGMAQTLRTKAAQYFAGDVTLSSFAGDRLFLPSDERVITEVLEASGRASSLTRRSEYFGGDATLFFNGASVRQRKLVGIDWSVEGPGFRQLDLVTGVVPRVDDARALLVSQATAHRLGARVGDDVTAVFDTQSGQRNSLELVVTGIYRDTSFFGYASYLNLGALNRALGRPAGAVTALGLMVAPGLDADRVGEAVRDRLAARVPTSAMIRTREAMASAMGQAGNGARVGVMTLGANLAQINDILDSLVAVALGATAVFLAIVVIGVGNTYRMVVYERTREFGTLRALGLGRGRLVALVAAEAGWLAVAGALTGVLTGGLLLGVLGLVDWEGGGALVGLFLQNGHLKAAWEPGPLVGALAVLVGSSLIGALGPAIRAARMHPIDALRSGE